LNGPANALYRPRSVRCGGKFAQIATIKRIPRQQDRKTGDDFPLERKFMPTRAFTTITGAGLAALLCAFSAFAHEHTALNGTWTLVPTQSDFAGQPTIQTGTVTIKEQQGVIVVTRSFVYEGATETFFYSDSTGSENSSTIHAGKDFKTKTKWDHDVLKVTTTQSGAITIESYALAADGSMTVSVIRPEQKPITLVFQRK
jgi:hypothetical protein